MNYFVTSNRYVTQMDQDGYDYYDSQVVLSTNSCKLQSVIAYNPSPPLNYLQVFDGYEVTPGDKPVITLALPPFESKQLDFGSINGLQLANGCVLALSANPTRYDVVEATETDGMFITAFFSDV